MSGVADDLWTRLKYNLAFRVGTVYAGASWFVVEAADTLGASPSAVRVIALALAAGFAIIVPSAWVIDRRARTAEAMDLSDGHWGIGTKASRHVRSRVGTRRWAATLGILVVLAGGLWFIGTRVYRGSVPEAATKIAVMPFHGTGSESAREFGIGIVNLLSSSLDHVDEIRTVSARTVLARTGTEPGTSPSLEDAFEIGSDVSAGSIVTGSVTMVGQNVRLTAEIRALADATVLASASAEGAEADILALTDELAVALIRDMWRSREPAPTVSTAGLLTSSPAALREYMRGERLLRSFQLDSATAAFRAATTADDAFALAWARLAESTSWGQEAEMSVSRRVYADNAVRHASRLPVRERSLIRAIQSKQLGLFSAADSLARYVQRYPDDPYGWYLLGDTRYHSQVLGLYSEAEIQDPFIQAVRLDPNFSLGFTHLIDRALQTGDREQFDALIAQYARVAPPARIAEIEAAARLRWAPSDSVLPVFLAEIGTLRSVEDRQTISRLSGTLGGRVRLDPEVDPDVYIEAFDSSRTLFAGDRDWQKNALSLIANAQFALGRPAQALTTVDELVALGVMGGALPPFNLPELQRPMARVALTLLADAPVDLIRGDVERIEAAFGQIPAHRIYLMKAGDFERASRYDTVLEAPPGAPPIDSPGVRLATEGWWAAFRGWEAALRGDAESAVRLLDDGFRRLGTVDMWQLAPAVFEYAKLLSERPDRRQQGIRMLRYFAHNRELQIGRTWLALGRALEADGDATGAREAYGHVLRLWANADEYLQDEVREARDALERLAVEVR